MPACTERLGERGRGVGKREIRRMEMIQERRREGKEKGRGKGGSKVGGEEKSKKLRRE